MSKNLFCIVVLCTGNSCRSQMAQVILETLLPRDKFQILSAGTEVHGLNPLAMETLIKNGLPTKHLYSKNIQDLDSKEPIDLVFSVCDSAREACPYIPALLNHHHSFDDPPKLAKGLTNNEAMAIYQRVFLDIKDYCSAEILPLIAT